MARTTGGRGVPKGTPRANAQELLNSLGRQIFGDEFQGGPVAASKGEFNQQTDVMYDDTESMDYYNPTQYRNLAGRNWFEDPGLRYDENGNPIGSSRPLYEVVELTGDLKIPGYKGPQNQEDSSPADLTVVPTSTTNPKRPRTVAAGYDEEEEKLTVVFRDGTFYNYYEVDANEWKAFKANRSKGAAIARMLDFKPRGPADMSSLSKKAQQAFYRFSRGAQIHQKGQAKGQTKTTFKTIGQSKRTAKATGKNPSKGGKAPKVK
jgi:hypothetical protein